MSVIEKEKYGKPLTAKSLAIAVPYLIILVVLSNFTSLYTSKGEVIPVFTLPFIYMAFLSVLLSKISPKLRLNRHEMVLLATINFFVIGLYAQTGPDCLVQFFQMYQIPTISGQVDPAFKEYFSKWVPSYMAPKSEAALSAYYYGLKPGQAMPWGEFTVPIVYQTVRLMLQFLFSWWLLFGVLGRRFVEVENLPFPMQVPFMYVIDASVDIEKETNKTRWFSLKIAQYKAFWIAFVVGLLLSAFPMYTQFFPLYIVGVQEYGATFINFTPLAQVLPGAHLTGTWQVDQWMLWMLLPINTLATMVIVWVAIELIWLPVAVQAGIVPYVPGGEFYAVPPQETNYPFPYMTVWMGVYIAFGLVTLWSVRGRFKELFDSLTGQDVTENGLSRRLMAIFGIIVTLALIVFFAASGVPVIVSLILVGMAFISYTFLAKIESIFWIHPGDFDGGGGLMYTWNTGASLGYWPSTPGIANMTYAAFATDGMQMPFNYNWNTRCNGFGPGGISGIYKIAFENKTNLRDLTIGAIIMMIIGLPIGFSSLAWFHIHGGGVANTHSWGSWIHGFVYGDLSSTRVGISGETNYAAAFPYHLLGAAIFLIVYALRMQFAWFWLDPAGLVFIMPYPAWSWLNALFALILKLAMVRVMGTTRFNNYIRSIAAGLCFGFGFPVFFAWIAEFATVMWPTFMSYYVP